MPFLPATPVTPLLGSWLDVKRTCLSTVYAFATPTTDALQAIQRATSSVVEVGAGTGYWASFLQTHGLQVDAYDVAPTTSTSAFNEYHSDSPSFTDVQQGDASVLLQKKYANNNWALLLCYPPPNDPMAIDCLHSFKGDVLLLVGEWEGDTGTREFEQELMQDWRLDTLVPLPNMDRFTHTVSYTRTHHTTPHTFRSNALSVWRRGTDEKNAPRDPLQCKCGSQASVLRCKLCREFAVCSAACAAAYTDAHRKTHEERFVFLPKSAETSVSHAALYADRSFFAFADGEGEGDDGDEGEDEEEEEEDEREDVDPKTKRRKK